ncbi:MAG TPA: biotin-dependent carboxyltransferase family protein [Burkholderiaceae bacterium]|nr:biotin-dependent carboxyltransferase family protein [Burkholderiaceae bacterium]HQR70686.1 biotin-dependent carboxyltransferase family protein [Burkholderiaceae bacterium]
MTIRVLRSGVLATVQDLGRPGMQHLAIVPGGAMDAVSHRIANALVGNVDDAASLEIALAGPELLFECDALIALHGARFEPLLDGAPMPVSRPVRLPAGARLRVGRAVDGAFGYLAVAGGIDVSPVLGSRSTYVPAAFGGLKGRAILAGDTLPLRADAAELGRARYVQLARGGRTVGLAGGGASVRWSAPMFTLPADPIVVRVVDGVHARLFSAAARSELLGARWSVAAESNRMGYRLAGPRLALEQPREIMSQPVGFGTVQVPASGQPIVLMADRQTTGGYPRIAEVIAADVPRIAQAVPGRAAVRFERVTLTAADAAGSENAKRVGDVIERLRWEFGDDKH